MNHASSQVDSSDVEARAKTLYNKLPGVLTFTNTRILWTKDGHSKPTVNVAHSKLTSGCFILAPCLNHRVSMALLTSPACFRHVLVQGWSPQEAPTTPRRRPARALPVQLHFSSSHRRCRTRKVQISAGCRRQCKYVWSRAPPACKRYRAAKFNTGFPCPSLDTR